MAAATRSEVGGGLEAEHRLAQLRQNPGCVARSEVKVAPKTSRHARAGMQPGQMRAMRPVLLAHLAALAATHAQRVRLRVAQRLQPSPGSRSGKSRGKYSARANIHHTGKAFLNTTRE